MRAFVAGRPQLRLGEEFIGRLFDLLGDFPPQTGPVVLRVRFIFEASNPRSRTPVSQPSLPGLVRGLLDVLCGLAWENEKQVVAIHAAKEYGNTSGTDLAW